MRRLVALVAAAHDIELAEVEPADGASQGGASPEGGSADAAVDERGG